MEKLVIPYFNGVLETVSDMFRILLNQDPPPIEVDMSKDIVSFEFGGDKEQMKHLVRAVVRAQQKGSVIPTRDWKFAKLVEISSGVFKDYSESLNIGYICAANVDENFSHPDKEIVKAMSLLSPIFNTKRSQKEDLSNIFRDVWTLLETCGYDTKDYVVHNFVITATNGTLHVKNNHVEMLWLVLRACLLTATVEYAIPLSPNRDQKISATALFHALNKVLETEIGDVRFGIGSDFNEFRVNIETSNIYKLTKKIADEVDR